MSGFSVGFTCFVGALITLWGTSLLGPWIACMPSLSMVLLFQAARRSPLQRTRIAAVVCGLAEGCRFTNGMIPFAIALLLLASFWRAARLVWPLRTQNAALIHLILTLGPTWVILHLLGIYQRYPLWPSLVGFVLTCLIGVITHGIFNKSERLKHAWSRP